VLDRHALTEIAKTEATRTAQYRPARNRLEAALINIWKSILHIDPIGVDDSFFELGGHSLKAMQLISRLRSELRVKVYLRDFMRRPTVANLAALVAESPRTPRERIEPAPQRSWYESSNAQQRLWLVHSMSASPCYNMPIAFLFDRQLDVNVLHDAFAALIARHEVLRTRFVDVDGEPRQEIMDHLSFAVQQTDLRDAPNAEQRAKTIVDGLVNERFVLTQPPLFRLAAQASLMTGVSGLVRLTVPSRKEFLETSDSKIEMGLLMSLPPFLALSCAIL